MNNLKLLKKYLQWYISSRNRHGVHSPFMYNLLDQCLYARQDRSIFKEIEAERSRLQQNRSILSYQDPGAGSCSNKSLNRSKQTTRSVREIARRSLQPAKYGMLLYRLARYFNCNNILEMGTSLGITTAYLSKAAPEGNISTMEGADAIADLAREVFNNLNCSNVTMYRGKFAETLPQAAREHAPWDLIFLDGDHNGEAVLNYFSFLVKHISKNGVLIVDDIRWSPSMWEAWSDIRKHPEVRVTVDLFFMGLVFFNPSLSHEHFSIRF